MLIRVGVEGGRRAVLNKARELNAPILVSANSLWDHRKQRFSGWECYNGFDCALDSGGFVAMKKYGGYRWAVEQYVGLAMNMHPTWWAQMDFCCEPEIASDKPQVWRRIDYTVEHLQECQRLAKIFDIPAPLPVLQGWEPKDYTAGPIYDGDYEWPSIVGVGSVCRRQVRGPNGIMAVVNELDRKVPKHVKFHLFGVKSQAIQALIEVFPGRVASMDSMAWNYAARWDAYHGKIPGHSAARAEVMARWYQKQVANTRLSDEQLMLMLALQE